uniref:Phenylalanine--tRNA ligase, mitochondrial n=1 Tax=Clastoptera arizonana TaxID=38151 RepID=A0A1B6CIP1_9HEMI
MRILRKNYIQPLHQFSTATSKTDSVCSHLTINSFDYKRDDFTNITPKILSHIGKNLHNHKHHPLGLIKQRIVNYFYSTFLGPRNIPKFAVFDNLHPVVTVEQNFDSLLIPKTHVSRNKSDCYYANKEHLLRAHMTAHQSELIHMGFDNCLTIGDVYRRDEIDPTHYPVFHQVDAIRILDAHQLSDIVDANIKIFEQKVMEDTEDKQGEHTVDSTKVMEGELKTTLTNLVKVLFGEDVEYRWVSTSFPFTHPSWELEVKFEGAWLEVLGCGITRHGILKSAGVEDKIGWAFGVGLERLAMRLYNIPDIRLFWSNDTGFLSQFKVSDVNASIKYKPVSVYPQCVNDISFWLGEPAEYHPNNFYELARDVGGDIVEQVSLIDEFKHKKTGHTSHCYRIIYRHMEKTLTQDEVNIIHKDIENAAAKQLGVKIR